MTALWTAAEAAKATGGRAVGDWSVTGVSIDSRHLAAGDLFVALTDKRDGHSFVAAALRAGAGAALVSHVPDGVTKNAPLLIVADVLEALRGLARAARARSPARVVAVTGSAGKTSTKEMLRAVLGKQGRTHAAERSFNNHWGVPLTLARMPADTDFAIVEIGMNAPGEIAPLARLARPHVAIVTNVAAAHLAAFRGLADIAVEKAAIFQGLEPGGAAIYNADLETSPILHDAAVAAGAVPVGFGSSVDATMVAMSLTVTADRTVIAGRWKTDKFLARLSVPGRHFAMNALAVLAAARQLDLDFDIAISDLGRWQVPDGRGRRETIVMDVVEDHLTFDLYNDAFNANPASMQAALEVLSHTKPVDGVGRIGKGRRVAVLGDMLELGTAETDLHAGLAGLKTVARIDQIHCVGQRMAALYRKLKPAQRGRWFERAEDAAAAAHTFVDAGDIVLVKGSKGSRVSLVVDALRKLGHPLATEEQGG